MGKGVLERYWRGPYDLREHEVVGDVSEEIRCDIRAGGVFPALRENEIHLYHEGGRLLRIRPKSAYSHSKYVGGSGKADIPVRKPLTAEAYQDLKECCAKRNRRPLKSRNARRETWIVSRLFGRFSAWAVGADRDQPRLIDVEVRLRRDDGRSADMVDMLFLDDDARLTFVEVKREYDGRIRSKEKPPDVVRQVGGYEARLQGNDSSILSAYGKVGSVLGHAFRLEPLAAPAEVFPRVPILVCRGRRSGREQDTWVGRRLDACADGAVDRDHLVVDGGAIEADVHAEARRPPPWCKSGFWEDVDLAQALQCVRGVAEASSARGSTP